MEPIIVGDRVYTSLAAAVADQPEGKGFAYSHARLAPPNVPPGELIQDLIVKAMYELNPKSADHSTLWKRYGAEVKYMCNHLSTALAKVAGEKPSWVAQAPQQYDVTVNPVAEEEE